MEKIFENKSINQIITDLTNQEYVDLEINGFDINKLIITSEKYPNIFIKPYSNDVSNEVLKILGNQDNLNIEYVDYEFTDFFVSTLIEDQDTNEKTFTTISLLEFIHMNSQEDREFIFDQCWNAYI